MRRLAYPILVLLLLAVLALPSLAQAQVGISPNIHDFPLDGKTRAFRLFNLDDTDKRVRVSVVNFDLDEANSVRVLPPEEQSLDQWLVINPLDFTVKAKSSQAVRFAVRAGVELAAGEHRAMIYFDEVPGEAEPEPGAHVTMRGRFRIGAAVYAQVGPVTREGTLGRPHAGANGFAIDVASTGSANVRFNAQYAVWRADAWPGAVKTERMPEWDRPDTALPAEVLRAGSLPSHAVLPATRRRVQATFAEPLPAGRYVLDLNGSYGATAIDEGVAFEIPAAAR